MQTSREVGLERRHLVYCMCVYVYLCFFKLKLILELVEFSLRSYISHELPKMDIFNLPAIYGNDLSMTHSTNNLHL